MIITINSDYFSKQRQSGESDSGDRLYLLCGSN